MRTLLLTLVSLTVLSCGDAGPPSAREADSPSLIPPPTFQDNDLERIYRFMLNQVGPEEDWAAIGYLEFDVESAPGNGKVSPRRHRWDRTGDRARVEFETPEGTVVAVFSPKASTSGRVWLDGVEQGPETAPSLQERARALHRDDRFWLTMPFTWTDSGVEARFVERLPGDDGRTIDVVEVTYPAGRAPHPRYRVFVDLGTYLIDRTAAFSSPDAEPETVEWSDWRDVGSLVFSLERSDMRFDRVRALRGAAPPGAFDPPPGDG